MWYFPTPDDGYVLAGLKDNLRTVTLQSIVSWIGVACGPLQHGQWAYPGFYNGVAFTGGSRTFPNGAAARDRRREVPQWGPVVGPR